MGWHRDASSMSFLVICFDGKPKVFFFFTHEIPSSCSSSVARQSPKIESSGFERHDKLKPDKFPRAPAQRPEESNSFL